MTGPSFGRLLSSEARKLCSVPGPALTLFLALIVLAGAGPLAAFAAANHAGETLASPPAAGPLWLAGAQAAQVLVALAGSASASAEVNTGTIAPTLLAAGRRLPALLAKATLFGAIAATLGGAGLVLSGFLTATIHPEAGSGGLPAVAGSAALLGGGAVLGVCLATLARRTLAATLWVLGLFVFAPLLLGTLPVSGAARASTWFPAPAGLAMLLPGTPTATLSPGTGALITLSWVLGVLALASWRFYRRDA